MSAPISNTVQEDPRNYHSHVQVGQAKAEDIQVWMKAGNQPGESYYILRDTSTNPLLCRDNRLARTGFCSNPVEVLHVKAGEIQGAWHIQDLPPRIQDAWFGGMFFLKARVSMARIKAFLMPSKNVFFLKNLPTAPAPIETKKAQASNNGPSTKSKNNQDPLSPSPEGDQQVEIFLEGKKVTIDPKVKDQEPKTQDPLSPPRGDIKEIDFLPTSKSSLPAPTTPDDIREPNFSSKD